MIRYAWRIIVKFNVSNFFSSHMISPSTVANNSLTHHTIYPHIPLLQNHFYQCLFLSYDPYTPPFSLSKESFQQEKVEKKWAYMQKLFFFTERKNQLLSIYSCWRSEKLWWRQYFSYQKDGHTLLYLIACHIYMVCSLYKHRIYNSLLICIFPYNSRTQ